MRKQTCLFQKHIFSAANYRVISGWPTQPQTCKLQQVCFRIVALLSSSRYQNAFAWLAPSWLSNIAASCEQACCKLIVKTFYPEAWCKLFQQLAASRQISSCNKSDFHRLTASWWIQQTCCNLLTTCSKAVKSATCSKSVAFLAVYWTIKYYSRAKYLKKNKVRLDNVACKIYDQDIRGSSG